MGRWDRFHEARSITAEAWLADEVVKSLVADLTGWPPPVAGWLDEAAKARFAPALEGTRPTEAVFRVAFQLARWELERSFEALDEFARNDRAASVASDARERLALRFLHEWLTGSMLELLEFSVLKRPKLVECLTRAEVRLFG
jgi:hypothetical protein